MFLFSTQLRLGKFASSDRYLSHIPCMYSCNHECVCIWIYILRAGMYKIHVCPYVRELRLVAQDGTALRPEFWNSELRSAGGVALVNQTHVFLGGYVSVNGQSPFAPLGNHGGNNVGVYRGINTFQASERWREMDFVHPQCFGCFCFEQTKQITHLVGSKFLV